MREFSLKQKLLTYLDTANRWVNKSELEQYSKDRGFLAENGDRRLRELYQAGMIERKLNEHGVAEYRIKKAERDIFGFEASARKNTLTSRNQPKVEDRLQIIDGRMVVKF